MLWQVATSTKRSLLYPDNADLDKRTTRLKASGTRQIPLIVYSFHVWEYFSVLNRRTTCGKCIFFRKNVRSGVC